MNDKTLATKPNGMFRRALNLLLGMELWELGLLALSPFTMALGIMAAWGGHYRWPELTYPVQTYRIGVALIVIMTIALLIVLARELQVRSYNKKMQAKA